MTPAVVFCLVIAIADGDTLTCMTPDASRIRVRLAQIDAPESNQPYGRLSSASLHELCYMAYAALSVDGKDRYSRTIAQITCNGINANAEQVRRGMAWVYDKYATEQSLYRKQAHARASQRGLWHDPAPTPPWEWRRTGSR